MAIDAPADERGLQTGLGRLMDYDAELRLLNQALRLAYGIERHDREISAGGLRVAVPPHLDQYPSDDAPAAVKLKVMPWCAGVWVAGI